MKLSSILKKPSEEMPTRSFVHFQKSMIIDDSEYVPIMFWLWGDEFNVGDIYFAEDDLWCHLDEFNKYLLEEINECSNNPG